MATEQIAGRLKSCEWIAGDLQLIAAIGGLKGQGERRHLVGGFRGEIAHQLNVGIRVTGEHKLF